MRIRVVFLMSAAFPTVSSLNILTAALPRGSSDTASTAAIVVRLAALADDKLPYSYVGNKKCKKCHIKQYRSWEETRMGRAFEILKPGNNTEAKSKFGLGPEKDYTADKECLKCHTVGFDEPGG